MVCSHASFHYNRERSVIVQIVSETWHFDDESLIIYFSWEIYIPVIIWRKSLISQFVSVSLTNDLKFSAIYFPSCVANVTSKLASKLTLLTFMPGQLNHSNLYNQPGYYNHIQMRALRDEYTKLPGIRFAWVMGKTAVQVSSIKWTIIFEICFLWS